MSSSPAPATVALVPLRSPGIGKSRLATMLSAEQRAALAGAMLADVTAALRSGAIDRVVVAAGGPAAVAAASALGLETFTDPPGVRGLDAALAAAAAQLGPVGTLVVVAADLPCLTGDEVEQLLAVDAEVVVAPTDDGGTGGFVRRPADACPTAYGEGSAARHLELARSAGRRTEEIRLPGFAEDVDVAADLARLTVRDRSTLGVRTAALLDQFDLPAAG